MANAQKSYAGFSTFSATGRVYNAEVVTANGGEFLAVTLITNFQDDDKGYLITFNTTNGLKSLFEKGYLPTGRIVTVTGQVKSMTETYLNENDEAVLLKNPRIALVQAFAHVGPMPASAKKQAVRRPSGSVVVRPSDVKKAEEMLDELAPSAADADLLV